jgi:hypothetical protein
MVIEWRYEMAYTPKDAAKDTNVSTSQAAKNWHKAKDDATAAGELPERGKNKVSDSTDGPALQNIFQKLGIVGKKKS